MPTAPVNVYMMNRLRETSSRLEMVYGRPDWRVHNPPLDELVATVLSQHTTDTNSERAFASLRSRFPTWEEVAHAPEHEVASAIRSGGLANIKAPRLRIILRAIEAETGDYSLDWLRSKSLPAARSYLQSLPGVGPKTAACVLLFSLGLPTMPVDTHVYRVGRRLGLIAHNIRSEHAGEVLDDLIGPNRDTIYALHMNVIRHGRSVCSARSPKCGQCVLAGFCPSVASRKD